MFDAIQKRISATLDGVDEVVRDVRRLIRDVRTEGVHIAVRVGESKTPSVQVSLDGQRIVDAVKPFSGKVTPL